MKSILYEQRVAWSRQARILLGLLCALLSVTLYSPDGSYGLYETQD